jgi:hypothetical protein
VVPIVEEGPGEFLAEVGQLAGRPALIDSRAKTEVEALLISPERLRGVIIAEAELGACARSSCAGVALIENCAGGPVLVGPGQDRANDFRRDKRVLQLFCVERLLPDQMSPFDRDALCAQTQRADRMKPITSCLACWRSPVQPA